MAGIPSRSIEAVCHNPTPAISFTASSVDNLSRISSILTLAKSEGGMATSDQTRSRYLVIDRRRRSGHQSFVGKDSETFSRPISSSPPA